MGSFSIVKSESFYGVKCDFWYDKGNDAYFMTSEQIGDALGYSEPRISIGNLTNRHEYLKSGEFSSIIKLITEVGERETRVFTEDGIYEVTMLAKTERAKEFRSKVRKVLKALRKTGTYSINPAPKEDAQLARAKAMLLNAKTRAAQMWLKIAASVSIPEYKQIASTYAANTLADKEILALPEMAAKTYTATEIGTMFGVSANKIGKLANANGLKVKEYGMEVWDKSPYSAKQIPSWRYYEAAIPVFRRLLSQEVVPLEVVKGGAAQ